MGKQQSLIFYKQLTQIQLNIKTAQHYCDLQICSLTGPSWFPNEVGVVYSQAE